MIHEQHLIDGNDNKPYSFSFAPNELSSLVGTDHLLNPIYMEKSCLGKEDHPPPPGGRYPI